VSRSADESAVVARALHLAKLRCTLWLATPQGKAALQQELAVQRAAAARAQGAWEALPSKSARAFVKSCWLAQREFDCCDVQGIGSIAVSELPRVLAAAGVMLPASALAAAVQQICSCNGNSASGSRQFTTAQLLMWLQQQQQGSNTAAPATSSATAIATTTSSKSKKLATAVQQSAAAVKHKLAQALTSSSAAAQRRAETALLTRHFAASAATSARTLFRVTRPPKFSCLACPAAFALYSDALSHYSCCHSCCSSCSTATSTATATAGTGATSTAAVTTESIAVVLPLVSVHNTSGAKRAVVAPLHLAAAARQLPQARRAAAQWRRHAAEVTAVTTACAQADASECVRLQSRVVGGGAVELELLTRGLVGGLLQQLKAVGSGKYCSEY
jgi:hypothetical protein